MYQMKCKMCTLKITKLMKEIKDLNKQRDIYWLWIRSSNTVKMAIIPKFIYRFGTNPVKIPATFFCRNGQSSKNSCGTVRDPEYIK